MVNDDFINIARIINDAQKKGILLFLDNDTVKYKFIEGASVDHSHLEEIKTYKAQIKNVLRNKYALTQSNTIPTGPRPPKIPLSFAQERLWFIDALEGSLPYHIPFALRLQGQLDRSLLEKALITIVNRHEVLRTVIAEEDGQPYQRILDKDGWKLGTAENLVTQAPFNLSADYLLRADLVQTAPAEHVLAGTMHHIVSDGWSIPILVKELTELYNAFVTGRPYRLPDLPVQYADYAIWQRGYLTGDVLQNKLAYWQQQLTDAPVLQLPTDHPRGAVRSNKGASAGFQLDKQLTSGLETLSLENGATLYMTLLSVFNILLYKYSGQEDICVGSPIAGRSIQETEDLIGFFVNTLVLRNRVSPEISFRHLLLQVKNTTLQAYAHQDVPFEKIVETLATERDLSRSPLFDVLFVLQNNPQPDSLEEALFGLSISVEERRNNTSQFDISVTLQQQAGTIIGSLTYNSDLYDHATIQRMITHYEQLLHAVVRNQDQRIDELEIITEAERRELLFAFNDTRTEYPRDKTVIDLFSEQAAKTPHNIAVVFEHRQLSYSQLDERSNQLGHLLRSRGVREDSLVVISMERSLEMIIAIIGVLKAGGAYVPVDPDYPQDRIAYMLEDTSAPIAITAGNVQLPSTNRLSVIHLDTDKALIDAQDTTTVPTLLLPSHLAYVIYTSGSTGRPKGVMIEHKSFVNLALSQVSLFDLNEDKIVLQFASLSFDASCSEIFTTLISGARLIIPTNQTLLSVDLITELIEKCKIDTLTIPPSYQLQIKGSLHSIKTIISAGEGLTLNLAKELQSAGINIVNAYGPTENTVCATFASTPIQNDRISIGRPIANTQIYILDPNHNLVPVGVTGEIGIGGTGLARGYLNRPDLTAEKFIPHPFSTEENARIYRTGDLGRWLPDGNIEFLGRLDDQVKIRGYRIEPGEIENALLQTGQVQQAVVLCKEDDTPGNKRLIAYLTPAVGYDRETTLAALRTRLPGYMIPGLLVELDALPLTPNGKTDRKALLAIDLSKAAHSEYEAPEGPLETQLAAIWSSLLGKEPIGRHDNFFHLGGHSLLAMQGIAVIRKDLSIGLSVADLFRNPTIGQLSNYIRENATKVILNNMSLHTDHVFPLTPGNKGKIVFFLPGLKGIYGGLDDLAQALASDFQIYGLHMMGLFENELPFKTMEEVAAQNIKWMKTIQPHGPYSFVGHSHAGYYVYEIARQLAGAGEEIDLAMIIDVTPRYPKFSEININNIFLVTKEMLENYNMIGKILPDWTEKLTMALKGIPMEEVPLTFEKALKQLFPELNENMEFVIRAMTLQTTNVLMKYDLKEKVNAEGIVVAGSASPYEDVVGWSNYFERSSFFVIEGDHETIVEGQGAIELARIIKEHFSRTVIKSTHDE